MSLPSFLVLLAISPRTLPNSAERFRPPVSELRLFGIDLQRAAYLPEAIVSGR